MRQALGADDEAGSGDDDDETTPQPPSPAPSVAGPSRQDCIACADVLKGDQSCSGCGEAVHTAAPCSSPGPDGARCPLCTREESAAQQRRSAAESQQRQDQRMLCRANRQTEALDVGTNVRIGIPDVDRARNQQRNIIGVVMEVRTPYMICVNSFFKQTLAIHLY